jgi:hypothetical protein
VPSLFPVEDPFSYDGPHPSESECPCPNPDGQYLMDIDCGSVSLTHKACGKPPRGDWMTESLTMDPVPVTVKAVPYGNCDGSMWHGEHQCDCGSLAEVTINGLTVEHDGVLYLVGRDYADRDGSVWRITDQRDRDGRPLVFLLPEGAGEDAPLEEIADDFGPLSLHAPNRSPDECP